MCLCPKSHLFSPLFAAICADRVCQMTKTYNDIEAVTRLLEEVSWLTRVNCCGASVWFRCGTSVWLCLCALTRSVQTCVCNNT